MGIMVYSLLWVMQDFVHQPYSILWCPPDGRYHRRRVASVSVLCCYWKLQTTKDPEVDSKVTGALNLDPHTRNPEPGTNQKHLSYEPQERDPNVPNITLFFGGGGEVSASLRGWMKRG